MPTEFIVRLETNGVKRTILVSNLLVRFLATKLPSFHWILKRRPRLHRESCGKFKIPHVAGGLREFRKG
ncbi:MAG: hypothetical protein HW398_1195 [Acidobacteria bacterium]|nr:hypothetical protein [Acidobacteriota bacterium]